MTRPDRPPDQGDDQALPGQVEVPALRGLHLGVGVGRGPHQNQGLRPLEGPASGGLLLQEATPAKGVEKVGREPTLVQKQQPAPTLPGNCYFHELYSHR